MPAAVVRSTSHIQENITMAEPYVGQVILFAGQKAPQDWHACDGTLLAIQTYPQLYALIGTRFGGDGVNTFALPDLRGRIAVGAGTVPNMTPRTLGQKGGAETVTLGMTNMPTHTHTAHAVKVATQAGPSNTMLWGGSPDGGTPLFSNGDPNMTFATGAISYVGGSNSGSANSPANPHNNVSPYIALNYIICLVGIFPTQN
jgi:microcystin-dependent protein